MTQDEQSASTTIPAGPAWVASPSPVQDAQGTNVIIVADLHCGSRLGLCPNEPIQLDDGGTYTPSPLQQKLYSYWRIFWDEWVPAACHREPFTLVVNGDIFSGRPFNSNLEISEHPEDCQHIAERLLLPIVERVKELYVVKGTEVHVGKAAHEEEAIARKLNAKPNEHGQYARYDLWLGIGKGLAHIMHHIGLTGSSHFESTAVLKELIGEFEQAARWGDRRPDVIARSHRHTHIEIRIPTSLGYGIAFVTAGWQLKTPHVWRIAGGRIAPPQFGGSLIRQGDFDLYTRHWTRTVGRTRTEIA